MDRRVDVELCLGSSCFARGNGRLLESLEAAVARNGWGGRVVLSGRRCGAICGRGPNLWIDGEVHCGLDEKSLLELLTGRLEREAPGDSPPPPGG
ncbi:MAG: NAD(P)H-dependent oxidoreductase subunit E [Planctomycetota bacterium]|jgi:NADH:ubiquinone oxidoreductase subunit E|nr:NAD(P)H-dependent oxidoreductase subunit E [Planctomycetota bacterium]